RKLEHHSGLLGLPLRLLAREIYDRVSARLGEDRVALVTGEEKRVPRRADYWICTTEAMPLTREVDFLAVDEIQLATHDERGHVFTDRLLHARGRKETWFMGAGTMREVLTRVVPAAHCEQHPRLSRLSFVGSSKLSRLRPRSAVVAFSLRELYSLAERLRIARGGTAVVLGALSPRARNAQVALFQSGEVDYLVATDAIGMGLNLDLHHVAFASLRKFDGQKGRDLDPAEIAQIAGRAGRFTRDGSFGTVLPLELERAQATRVEMHQLEPVRRLRYRNSDLDFSSLQALLESLRAPPPAVHFTSGPSGDDLRALEMLSRLDPALCRLRDRHSIELLWQICQIPDFRKILFEVHVELLHELFIEVQRQPLRSDFMATQLSELQRVDGDIDTLMARISRLRTWAFVANQANLVQEPARWQAELAQLEDRLSDALHAALVDRFVERRARTSMPRPAARVSRPLESSEDPSAFRPFAGLEPLRDRLLAVSPGGAGDGLHELEAWTEATHEAFELARNGEVSVKGTVIARLVRGASLSTPEVRLVGMEEVGPGLRSRLQRRLLAFARDVSGRLLAPVRELGRSDVGALRAIAYQLEQGLGSARKDELSGSLSALELSEELLLRQRGVVVGRYSVHLPALLRPAALLQRATLLAVYESGSRIPATLGRASYPVGALGAKAWLALGYVALGPRALRVDLMERLAEEASLLDTSRMLGSLGVPRHERARVSNALEQVR
ncbi:MAG TPA: helicase-related protein, partial [Polyangiaceae bacterium]|nr:helicase-related protein [Polyangiaceae bacterium]